jgi:single-strand DNA-binding protein
MNFNKVILGGRLTRDPELRFTPKKVAICALSLAVNRTYTGSDGIAKEEVAFVDVEAFAKQAETIAKHFTKGSRIHLEGRLKFDQWEKNGEKRSRLGVVLESWQFVDYRSQAGAPSGASVSGPSSEEDYSGIGD